MPADPTPNRGYFQFTKGETPDEIDLNDNLVAKIDADVHQTLTAEQQLQSDLEDLTDRVDAHSDGAGNLTGVPPEFTAFAGTLSYISTTQFSVVGNFTNDFSLNRAIRLTLSESQPVSDIQNAQYSVGTNTTTITLFDAVLDNTLSAAALGFIKNSMPKVALTDLAFDPATQAELDAHKTSGDHDAKYVKKAANDPVATEVVLNDLRVQKNSTTSAPRIEVEDTKSLTSLYRIGRWKQVEQLFRAILVRADNLAEKLFFDLDGANDKIVLQQLLDANSKRIINLPTAGAANDPVRHGDTDPFTRDLQLKKSSPFIRLIGTEGSAKDWRAGETGGLMVFQQNTGTELSPVWATRFQFRFNGAVENQDVPTKVYVDTYTRNLAFAKVTKSEGNYNLTGDFADIPGLTATITTGARRVRVDVVIVNQNSAGGSRDHGVRILLDGVPLSGSDGNVRVGLDSDRRHNMSFSFTTNVLTAAEHVFKIQAVSSNASGTQFIYGSSALNAVLVVQELPR